MKIDLNSDQVAAIARRFWKKVRIVEDEDSCWPWLASRIHSGHGNFSMFGATYTAHSVAWLLSHGEIPAGLFVLHTCDNGWCMRPSHLYLGTQSQNMLDRRDRGRAPLQKLTQDKADEIRSRYITENTTYRKLGREYGVSHTTIKEIVNGDRWAK